MTSVTGVYVLIRAIFSSNCAFSGSSTKWHIDNNNDNKMYWIIHQSILSYNFCPKRYVQRKLLSIKIERLLLPLI